MDGVEVLYMWVDGIYIKAGLEREKAALLVMLGALSDGRKVILTLDPGYRESTEGWSGVLRDLRERGINCPRLVIDDGNLGVWGALANVYPEAAEQRCWNHKIVNVMHRLPQKAQTQAIQHLRSMACAEKKRDDFLAWCRRKGYQSAADTIIRDWERMVTLYRSPKEHWKHLRTSNPVESPFAALRLGTDATKRFKKVENATAVIWKMLMLAKQRFRRLDAPEKLMQVHFRPTVEEQQESSRKRYLRLPDINQPIHKTSPTPTFCTWALTT